MNDFKTNCHRCIRGIKWISEVPVLCNCPEEEENVEVNSFNLYQDLAQRTANKSLDYKTRLAVAGLGITGEAGEVADIIKKHIGHGHPLDKEKLAKELGDNLWYIQEISQLLEITLDQIALDNINKLMKRYPEGFSENRSLNRVEE